ncbi:MAG: glucose 1-dehydrogenase [Chloroflexi bacterium]|nr:glucose 1-dehydrogenase [Chloroflexota bacterium]MCY3939346.1 glucose 1-dehydrogenase [Chloroflexota bacterium]
MTNLEGRAALVTGSATGAGASIALALADEGVNICVNYSRSKDEAEATVEQIRGKGVEATIFQCNVGDDSRVVEMVAHAADAFGRLDILVNNAGTTHFIPHTDLEALSESVWDDILRINVKGAYFASRAAMPHLRESSDGCIVNVSSIAGLMGTGSSIAYAASKAALNSMTMSLARAFAPEVRVNAIAPGVILTRWVEGKTAFIDAYVDKAPLQKASSPEDVAHMAVFLAEAHNVTGQTLVIDGGYMLG